ncbi:CcdB family protein [Limobrevibacterium gyesilva]|uniref:Toxin CcdB n=1 Tax=Limobrevibacterium gyesilva TaxID=2991712 RepID=A0AA41YUN9_9PROT|nr:CcdB family protein [Limobrevibacterium gyesilva]MCW3476903.1 CcdB family protein [Limobrevibacterium gyesilva]
MQCDVHRNPGDSRDYAPFLLDVQADLLDDLDTRVVVPLVHARVFGRRAERLHPLFNVEGQDVVMATHLVAAVKRTGLGVRIASLRDQREVVIGAIDVLLAGV